jgi:exodeoxyribonuclease VII large subunit
MDVKQELLTTYNVEENSLVTAVGIIRPTMWNRSVNLRLNVIDFEVGSSPEAVTLNRTGQEILSFLQSVDVKRQTFPVLNRINLTLIHPRSAQTTPDFLNSVKRARSRLNITEVSVNVHNSSEIAKAIGNAKCDVLVVIRGGGETRELAVFNNKEILEALAKCPAFRILGIGHSNDRTIADLFVDHVANTPSNAGEFVANAVQRVSREQVAQTQAVRYEPNLYEPKKSANWQRVGRLLFLIVAAAGAGVAYLYGPDLFTVFDQLWR